MTPRTIARAVGGLLLAALAFYVVNAHLAGSDADSEPASMRDRIAVKAVLARRADALHAADSLRAAERVADALRARQRVTRDSLRAVVTLTPTPGFVAIRDSLVPVPIEVTQLLVADDTLIAGLTRDVAARREESDSLRSALAASDTAHAIVTDTLTRAVRQANARTRRAYLRGGVIGAALVVLAHFVLSR